MYFNIKKSIFLAFSEKMNIIKVQNKKRKIMKNVIVTLTDRNSLTIHKRLASILNLTLLILIVALAFTDNYVKPLQIIAFIVLAVNIAIGYIALKGLFEDLIKDLTGDEDTKDLLELTYTCKRILYKLMAGFVFTGSIVILAINTHLLLAIGMIGIYVLYAVRIVNKLTEVTE